MRSRAKRANSLQMSYRSNLRARGVRGANRTTPAAKLTQLDLDLDDAVLSGDYHTLCVVRQINDHEVNGALDCCVIAVDSAAPMT